MCANFLNVVNFANFLLRPRERVRSRGYFYYLPFFAKLNTYFTK